MTTETRRDFWLDKPEEFYRWSMLERRYVRVEGKPVHFEGWGEIDAFLAKHPIEGWFVYHGPDGCVLTNSPLPRFECPCLALMHTEKYLSHTGRKMLVSKAYERIEGQGGLSPRYRWEDEVEE